MVPYTRPCRRRWAGPTAISGKSQPVVGWGIRDPNTDYPLLLDGTGRCPPEDVGGPWGYGDFLEAITDPAHESHAHWLEWAPPDFDPNDAQLDELKALVAKLAKRWKPRRKKKKSH